MNKIRTRVNVSLIILLFISLAVIGLWVGYLFKDYYLTSFKEKMENEAKIITEYVEMIGLENPTLIHKMERLSNLLGTNVLIASTDGKIINDTNHHGKNPNFLNEEGFHKEETNGVYYYGFPLTTVNEIKGYIFVYYETDTLDNFYKSMWVILFISLSFAYIGLLFVSFQITKQLIKPIEDINRVALELANGNYEARTYEHRFGETGVLSHSINRLAYNLSRMTAEKEKQTNRLQTLIENMGSGLLLINEKGNVSIVNRALKKAFGSKSEKWKNKNYKEVIPVDEVTRLIEETFTFGTNAKKQVILSFSIERKHFVIYSAPILNDERELQGVALLFHDISELKALEQMRKDFVANVSHELKTPMTSIKGFAETLLDGALEDEQTATKFLEIILNESDRLQQLLDDLLQLSRLEQENFSLQLSRIPLKEVVEECTLLVEGKARKKNIHIESSFRGDTHVIADQARVKQVFLNLLSNAITYTPSGGSIYVKVSELEKTVTFSIEDTGIGIAEDQLPRIFERFYRVDKARSRQSGGTGLGLAIVKHIVEAHKGKIKVTSVEGQGTTFTIVFKKKWKKK